MRDIGAFDSNQNFGQHFVYKLEIKEFKMFYMASETHEPMMTTSPPLLSHGHGNQSQFLPGYLLGDHSVCGTPSPKLWSTSNLSPGQKTGSLTTPSSASGSRHVSRSDSVKGRSGGPPVRSIFPPSSTEPSMQVGQSRVSVTPASRIASPGPPTSGLFATPTGLKDLSLNQSTVIPASPSQLDPFYTQGESLKSDDVLDETWVTIFGFPPGATSFILQQFSQYGNILRHVPTAEGNWMHVHYQSKLQAKKALSKNGKVYGGRMMIGVLPCIDKALMEGKENIELCSTSRTPLHTEFISPVRSSAVTPIRPLTAAYASSRSEYEVLKNKQTPKKDNSVVSKVKEYMFGW